MKTLAYFGNLNRVRKWTPGGGVKTLASGFTELGTFCVKSNGDLIVADRGGNYVLQRHGRRHRNDHRRERHDRQRTDGASATATAFYGARGVWPVPTGGYLLLLHDGAQLWYIDAANTARLLVNGIGGNVLVQAGDGQFFYAPSQALIGEGRSVTMDYAGNISSAKAITALSAASAFCR